MSKSPIVHDVVLEGNLILKPDEHINFVYCSITKKGQKSKKNQGMICTQVMYCTSVLFFLRFSLSVQILHVETPVFRLHRQT
jgi:hypothetical protein